MGFSWLDDTGRSDETFAIGEGIQDVLIEWGNEVNDKLQKSLVAKISSGTTLGLQQSLVVMPIEIRDSKFTLKFLADDPLWRFINKGVSGSSDNKKKDGSIYTNKAPASPFSFKDKKPRIVQGEGISLWAYAKGANVWVVQNSIFHKGIKPTHFWDEVINQNLVKDLVKRLEKAGAKEVELVLSKDFK